MIRSMTGLGFAEGEFHGARITVELRTVNHRGLDISLRLPRFLATMEVAVRRAIQENLTRGKVTAAVTWEGDSDGAAELRLDRDAAERYIKLLTTLQQEYGLPGEIDILTVAARPEIVTWERPGVSEEDAWGVVEPLVRAAAKDLDSMRANEGRALAADLQQRIVSMNALVEEINTRAPQRVQALRDAMHARLVGLLQDIPVDDQRLAMEIAMHADRLDVTEECVRLRAHNAQFLELLHAEDAGRKLNFLLQEMNREVNTIGSKANDVEIVNRVVVLKEEIEKIREQVQNVE